MAGGGACEEDDDTIVGDQLFLRRIPPHWITDARPGSDNFKLRSGEAGLSVTLWEGDEDFTATEAEQPTFGIVAVTASELRAAGYAISRRPLDENPNHCECTGKAGQGSRRKLARGARWVKPPHGHNAELFGTLFSRPA